jgi:hypothetical protein
MNSVKFTPFICSSNPAFGTSICFRDRYDQMDGKKVFQGIAADVDSFHVVMGETVHA